MNHYSFISAISALVLGASLVGAQTPVDDRVPTKIVTYSDLNLASPDGAASLKRRVASAVQLVCGDADNRDLDRLSLVQTCRRTARAKSDPLVVAAIAHANQRLAGDSRITVASR